MLNNKIAVPVEIGPTFNSVFGQGRGFADLVSIFLFNALAMGGVIMIVLFVIGGFMVLIGAGEAKPEKTVKGRSIITSSIIGFLIIFAAYWIISAAGILFGYNLLDPTN